MSLWYDSDTDTVVKDTEPTDDNPQTENEDWREKSEKGTFDPANVPDSPPTSSPPSTPPDESPDDSEGSKSRGPATRYDEIALDQLAKAGFTGKDLGDAGIRITHHLGAEQGLTAKELLDTLAEMTDDEIRDMVDKAMHDLTTVDREGNEKFDFARDYMQKLYEPRPDSSALYGIEEKPPAASAFSPAPPAPTSFAAIRHDPDLLERYYRALDVYHNALGHGMTDEERQKLADTLARGGLWKELDELREKQLKDAADFFSPKAPQAEDYPIRHPGFPSNVGPQNQPPRAAGAQEGARSLDYGLRHPGAPYSGGELYNPNSEAEDYALRHPGFTYGGPGVFAPNSQAEDYALRHPGFTYEGPGSYAPLSQAEDYGVRHPVAYDTKPPLSRAIDTIRALPGDAKDAAQYISNQTYGTPLHLADDPIGRYFSSHFGGVGGVPGDIDFQPQFRDNRYYNEWWGGQPIESKQFGHFWTAVEMGINGSPDYKSQIIKHEQIPDDPLLSSLALIGNASPEDLQAFDWAIVFDVQGDYESRDAMLMTILDPDKHGNLKDRRGNSLEDLRLSVRGWELGRDIALGELKTSDELADWIEKNIVGAKNR